LRGLQTRVPGVHKRRHLLSPQDFDGRTLMTRMFQSPLVVLAAATERRLAKYVQFLEAENRMLRGRLPKRLVVTPQERRQLLKLGQPLGLALREMITIVSYPTFLRWVREAKATRNDKPKPIGRPKKPLALHELILKVARETGWGYTRMPIVCGSATFSASAFGRARVCQTSTCWRFCTWEHGGCGLRPAPRIRIRLGFASKPKTSVSMCRATNCRQPSCSMTPTRSLARTSMRRSKARTEATSTDPIFIQYERLH